MKKFLNIQKGCCKSLYLLSIASASNGVIYIVVESDGSCLEVEPIDIQNI